MSKRDPSLIVQEVHRAFGDREVLRGISFTVGPGELYALLGPNGAGKTTTIRILLGLLRADHGEVVVHGRPLSQDRDFLVREMGFVLEQPRMVEELTLEQNLRLYASIYRLTAFRERIERLIADLGLEEWRDEPLFRFSKGMKQKAALGRALVHEPSVLVLDEPLSGLDPLFQEDVRRTLCSLRARGAAILICSHDLSEAERLCSHVGILNNGQLVAQGTPISLRETSRWKKVRLRWQREEQARVARAVLQGRFLVRESLSEPTTVDILVPRRSPNGRLLEAIENLAGPAESVSEPELNLEDIFHCAVAGDACGDTTDDAHQNDEESPTCDPLPDTDRSTSCKTCLSSCTRR